MLQEDLLALREKTVNDYAKAKQNKLSEVTLLETELANKLQTIDIQIDSIKVTDQFKAETKDKIAQNLFTNADYFALTPEKKEFVKEALFDEFSKDVNVYHSLGAIEFFVIATFKLMEKIMDTSKLTADELAFYNAFKAIVDPHPFGINDASAWQLTHIDTIQDEAVAHREQYFAKKVEITGSV